MQENQAKGNKKWFKKLHISFEHTLKAAEDWGGVWVHVNNEVTRVTTAVCLGTRDCHVVTRCHAVEDTGRTLQVHGWTLQHNTIIQC